MKVKKNQVHVVLQSGCPIRVYTEGKRYKWFPFILPVYGMKVFKLPVTKEKKILSLEKLTTLIEDYDKLIRMNENDVFFGTAYDNKEVK